MSDPLATPADEVLVVVSLDRRQDLKVALLKDKNAMMWHAFESYIAYRLTFAARLPASPLHHFQQAVEKAMKAFLISKDGQLKTGKTHDLTKLAGFCARWDKRFNEPEWQKVFNRLTPFNEAGRYPSEEYGQWGHRAPSSWLDAFLRYVAKETETEFDSLLQKIQSRSYPWDRNEQLPDSDYEVALLGLQASLRAGQPIEKG